MDLYGKDFWEFLKSSISEKTFKVGFNISIYRKIAKEYDSISLLKDEDAKKHFVYLQTSAFNNVILDLGKIYDREGKYPTRCMDAVLNCVAKNLKDVEGNITLVNDLEKFLIESKYFKLTDNIFKLSQKEFLKEFIEQSRLILGNDLKESIENLKLVRDKGVAHNELSKYEIDNGHVEELHQFAIEIQTILERIFCNIIINDNIDKAAREKQYDMESYFVDLILKQHMGK